MPSRAERLLEQLQTTIHTDLNTHHVRHPDLALHPDPYHLSDICTDGISVCQTQLMIDELLLSHLAELPTRHLSGPPNFYLRFIPHSISPQDRFVISLRLIILPDITFDQAIPNFCGSAQTTRRSLRTAGFAPKTPRRSRQCMLCDTTTAASSRTKDRL